MRANPTYLCPARARRLWVFAERELREVGRLALTLYMLVL
jgi:hypothetical protein